MFALSETFGLSGHQKQSGIFAIRLLILLIICTNCYATVSVSGGDNVGGLVGFKYQSDVEASFWDIQTSDHATSAGGSGKTTTEMHTARTFHEAGWDFVDETENGTEDIWWILEGQDYPRLWWELIEDESGALAEKLPAGQ